MDVKKRMPEFTEPMMKRAQGSSVCGLINLLILLIEIP
jgi:hypothetical protein